MATKTNTIKLRFDGHWEEGRAGGAVTPGMCVELQPDGEFDQMVTQSPACNDASLLIAFEDGLQAKLMTTAYEAGDLFPYGHFRSGDRFHAFVKAGENIAVGDTLQVEGGGSGYFVEVVEANEAEVPLTSGRAHDALATPLPATAANDDMGIITGTPGTDSPTLQGVDFGGTTADEKAAFEVVLPEHYQDADSLSVRVRAAMLTTVSDGTATVDVEAWLVGEDGAVGADLCATEAQDMNSLTPADLDFVITPTTLVAGSKLIIRVSFAASDTGNAGVMIPEISKLSLVLDQVVGGRVKATESTSGELDAAAHVAVTVL